MKKKYNIIDLFCGTGGFSEGFINFYPEFQIVYSIDIDSFSTDTIKANQQHGIVETKDIRSVSPKTVDTLIENKEIDIIIGGPPCQGFSSLRPNRSSLLEDERNSLYLEFASFVEYFRPKIVVMENVVGILTHNAGRTLEMILSSFDSLGYNVDWKILNAASYGVPQKRERFIMIAVRDNAEVHFPDPTHFFNGKVIGHKDKRRYVLAGLNCPKALTVNDAISDLPVLGRGEEITEYDSISTHPYQTERRKGAKIITLHKAANHSDKMMEVIKHAGGNIKCIPSSLISSGFSSSYSRLNGDEPSTTITIKFQSPASNKCIHPFQNRTLSPREAARIQSFDDKYIFKGPLTQVAKQIGNAVPPLLGRAIAKAVLKMLK